MSRRFSRLLCTFVAIAVSSLADRAAAQPTVRVSIVDHDQTFLAVVDRARSIAGELYAQAGIRIEWVDPAEGADDPSVLTVVVTSRQAVPSTITADAMGVTPTPGDGTRGRLAYVFSDRVITFATDNHLLTASVLACAVAHEVGHLLLPANAHTTAGLMRPDWFPGLFPPQAPGLPGFEASQARLLQRRVVGR